MNVHVESLILKGILPSMSFFHSSKTSKRDRSRGIRLTFAVLTFIVCGLTPACVHRGSVAFRESASNVHSLENAININTASLDELQRIPYVGEKLAAKIIEHREVNGPFRRAEHLMLIQGISDTRFRKIRPLVRVE